MIYCLKATKSTNDIDLKALLSPKIYDKIRKSFNLEEANSLLVMADLGAE